MAKDHRYDAEKEQAFKFIRVFLDVEDAWVLTPESIVRAVVALAETPDEKYRKLAIEFLCELCIRNIPIVAQCGGLKVLFAILIDGPSEYSDMIILSIVHILDTEKARRYIRPEVEFETLLAPFTDTFSSSSDVTLKNCAKALSMILQTWSGIMYVCMYNRAAIRSLIEAFKLPSSDLRVGFDVVHGVANLLQKILLSMFFDIFHVDVPAWYYNYVSSQGRLGMSLVHNMDTESSYYSAISYPRR